MGAILALGAGIAIAQTETETPPPASPPQTQYVIEQLVVTVNGDPEGGGERVDQIKSGDRVEVLNRQGEQAHVRLPSGREGWVRSSYLSTTPPMREQLKARTDELEKVRAEKSKLETELASARKAASAAASTATATPPPTAASAPAPVPPVPITNPSGGPAPGSASSETQPSNPPMFASDGVMPSRPSWLTAIAVSVLTLIAGFVLGWRVLDKRIRAKYGGLRIY
jgi:hypothetical protein